MTEQDYREIKAEVKNSAIPIKSQKMILEACEKQVEKTPTSTGVNFSITCRCVECSEILKDNFNYCPVCGNKIDWS